MKKKTFWQVVKDIDWGNRYDYKNVDPIPDIEENFRKAIKHRKRLQNAIKKHVKKNYDGHFWDFLRLGDDSFWDLTAHIVGLGYATYFKVLKNPELIKEYLSGPFKFQENFEYCFSHQIHSKNKNAVQDIYENAN